MTGKRTNQRIAFWIFRILGLIVVGILFWILGFIIWHGAGVINWKFLTTAPTDGMTGGGIFPAIVGTFCLIAGSMVVAFPLGVMSAIYTTEYAGNGKIVRFIRIMTNNLGSIPSIIFGLVGILLFVQRLGLKAGILAGGLTLVVMILPTIVRTTQESLKTVPQSYREGALGLGAGKWHMIRTVVLPGAVDGIVTGCILAVGRIVGESAALLYTAGFGLELVGFIKSLHTSAASLTVALYVYATERGETALAFSIATILMVLTLLINLSASLVGRKLRKK